MPLYLKSLFGKLNETTRAALENATALCVARGHVHIEIEHYLAALSPVRHTDLARICSRFQIDTARLDFELQRSLGELRGGHTGGPALGPALVGLLRDAWCVGSLEFGASKIRSGFTLLALIDPDRRYQLPAELGKLNAATVAGQFEESVRKSVENEAPPPPPPTPPPAV